jgi:hypothetical protein
MGDWLSDRPLQVGREITDGGDLYRVCGIEKKTARGGFHNPY